MKSILDTLCIIGNTVFNLANIASITLLWFAFIALSQIIKDLQHNMRYRVVNETDNINALRGIKIIIGINIIMYALLLGRYLL